MIYISSFF